MLSPVRDESAVLRHLEGAFRVLSGNQPHRLGLYVGRSGGRNEKAPLARFAALPGLNDPRVLLPLDTTRAGLRASVRQHARSAANPMVQLSARALEVAVALGVAKTVMRQRVRVEAIDASLRDTPLHSFLAEKLGRRDLSLALRLAPGRPNSKPVVQVMDRRGSIIAYAKFGWEPLTRRLIRQEARLLRALAAPTAGTAVTVPGVLHSGPWHGIETLILSPLTSAGRMPSDITDIPAAASRTLAGIGAKAGVRLGDSRFWRETRSRVDRLGPLLPDSAEAACEAVHRIETLYGEVSHTFGLQHGDWIPPNMVVRKDGGVDVWDWERGRFGAPRGLDTVQFVLFQLLRRVRSAPELALHIRRMCTPALARDGVAPGLVMPLACISLMHTILWIGEARQFGREADSLPRHAQALEIVVKELKTR